MMLLVVGLGIGYGAHEIEQYRTTQTLADVLILKKYDDKNYRMQTEWGQAFKATLCPETTADWEAGEKLAVWNYRQMQDCKSMNGRNLGYVAYANQDGTKTKFNIEEISLVTRHSR